MDYGASPTASADANTQAIQAAINAANVAGGGMVFIGKPGVYLINAELNQAITPHGLYLKDSVILNLGMGVTLKAQTATGDTYSVVFAYNANHVGVIGDGCIMGDRDTHADSGEAGRCIHIYHGQNVRIENVELMKANGDGFTLRGNCRRVRVRNAYCHDNLRHGGAVTGGIDAVIEACRLIDNGHIGLGGHGLDIEQDTDTNLLSSVRVSGNHAEGNNNRGINVNGGTDILVTSNVATRNEVGLSVTNTADWQLSHNAIRGNTGDGIVVQIRSKYGQVVHNHVTGNGRGISLDASIDNTVLVEKNVEYGNLNQVI